VRSPLGSYDAKAFGERGRLRGPCLVGADAAVEEDERVALPLFVVPGADSTDVDIGAHGTLLSLGIEHKSASGVAALK
jgi:HSP20 family molecular chaperone IbpA